MLFWDNVPKGLFLLTLGWGAVQDWQHLSVPRPLALAILCGAAWFAGESIIASPVQDMGIQLGILGLVGLLYSTPRGRRSLAPLDVALVGLGSLAMPLRAWPLLWITAGVSTLLMGCWKDPVPFLPGLWVAWCLCWIAI